MKVEKTVASVARDPRMYGARMYTILSTIARLGQQFTGSDKKAINDFTCSHSYPELSKGRIDEFTDLLKAREVSTIVR